jgi:hypothetical protein
MIRTPVEELRKPHPDQARIDAYAAALLRAAPIPAPRGVGRPKELDQQPGTALDTTWRGGDHRQGA